MEMGNMSTEDEILLFIRNKYMKKYDMSHSDLINQLQEMTNLPISKRVAELDAVFSEPVEGGSELLFDLGRKYDDYIHHTKRSETGSYYTPEYLVKYMVDLALSKFEGIDVEQLRTMRIIDLSCGTGALIYGYISNAYDLLKAMADNWGIDPAEEIKHIVLNNVYGIDIQEVPLEILAISILDFLRSKGVQLDGYERLKLFNGNAVTEETLFGLKGIGKFDIVIGNPPYVGEKGNRGQFETLKKSEFGKKYYEGKMDLFYFFIYRGIECLKPDGVLCYISTNYFVTADGAKKLRSHIREHTYFSDLVNFNDWAVFPNIKSHTMIYTLRPKSCEREKAQITYFKTTGNGPFEKVLNQGNKINKFSVMNEELFSEEGIIKMFAYEESYSLANKILKQSFCRLGDVCEIKQGIVSGGDRVSPSMINGKLLSEDIAKYDIEVGDGIFVLSDDEVESLGLNDAKYLRKFYKNSDIVRYGVNLESNKSILYITDVNTGKISESSKIISHLKRYKSVLDKRREVMNGKRKWFSLQWYRSEELFLREKIVVPQRSKHNKFGYSEGPWFGSADIYYIVTKGLDYDLFYLLGLLNSKLMYFWLYTMGKRKGESLELYSMPLQRIPIKSILEINNYTQIVEKTRKIVDTIKWGNDPSAMAGLMDDIDRMIYSDYSLTEDEIKFVERVCSKNY